MRLPSPNHIVWQLVFASVALVAHAAAAPPRVELEVVMEARVSPEVPQRWLRLLSELPFDSVRMRQIRSGEQPRLEAIGTGPSQTLRIRGVLGRDGQLQLPEGRFRLSDRQQLLQWFQRHSDVGSNTKDRNTQDRQTSFGLTDSQLVSAFRALAAPLNMETRDQPVSQVVQQIQTTLNLSLQIDQAALRTLRSDHRVRDELNGLSCGTALAAALRPRGLAVVPQMSDDGSLAIRVVSGKQATEVWPIGWDSDQPQRDAVPKLFDYLRVEIASTPLSEALDAVQPRLQVPILWDHNGIAAARIDPESIRVRFPAKRTFYKRLLDQILFQARLEAQLRMDEAQQPFLWITPIARS